MGMELLNERGWDPGMPLGYMGRIMGRFELSKLPEMAEAMGSSNDEDTRRTSRGDENPSTNVALSPPDVYGLISIDFRTSIFAPVISSW
jgi:hypothetical protein